MNSGALLLAPDTMSLKTACKSLHVSANAVRSSARSTLVAQEGEPSDEDVMREYLNQQVPPVAVPPEGASEGAWLTFWHDCLKREHGREPSEDDVYTAYIDHQVEVQLKTHGHLERANETSSTLPDGESAPSPIHA